VVIVRICAKATPARSSPCASVSAAAAAAAAVAACSLPALRYMGGVGTDTLDVGNICVACSCVCARVCVCVSVRCRARRPGCGQAVARDGGAGLAPAGLRPAQEGQGADPGQARQRGVVHLVLSLRRIRAPPYRPPLRHATSPSCLFTREALMIMYFGSSLSSSAVYNSPKYQHTRRP
jgi:hypothetical protein